MNVIAVLLLTVSMLSNPNGALFVDDYGIFVAETGKLGAMDGKILVVENLMGDKHVLTSTGLIDPKGMTFDYWNKMIIVTDGDSLKAVDPENGKVTVLYGPEDFPVEPKYLNGVLWNDGKIYVTDTELNKVFKIENGKIEELVSLKKPSGLAIGNDGELYIASFADPQGQIYRYKDGQLRIFVKEADLNGTYGLYFDKRRGFLIASGYWSGKLVFVEPSGRIINKLSGKLRHPAGISYDPANMYIFIADADRNSLFVYKLRDDFKNVNTKNEPGACSVCGK